MRSSRTMLATCRAALASYAAVEERRAASKVASRWPSTGGGHPPSLGSSAVRRSSLAAASRVMEAIAHLVSPMRAHWHSAESNTITMAITAPFLIGYRNSLLVHTCSCWTFNGLSRYKLHRGCQRSSTHHLMHTSGLLKLDMSMSLLLVRLCRCALFEATI